MKLHIFAVSYYVQQVFADGADKALGPVLLQPLVNVAAETQEEAIALVKAADGFERTVTGVANGTQDVLVADSAPADSSEADSLKAALSAKIEENTAIVESHKELADQLTQLRADNSALTGKIAAIEGDLAKATEQLNQKPQPQPQQPAEPSPAPAPIA